MRRRVSALFLRQPAAAQVATMCERKHPKRKRRPPIRVTLQRAMQEAQRRTGEGDWSDLRPQTFVQLWAWCHQQVYGVLPSISAAEWEIACKRVGQFVKLELDGRAEVMLDYMRWLWAREKDAEEWRRRNKRDGGVLGWQRVCSTKLLTEYRISLSRRAARG